MPAPSSNSFIPKRGPAKKKRKTTTRQVFIFTYISYILTFATLLAAGGVFIYERVVDQQLTDEIAALNQEIDSFSQTDMQRVTEFDQRLQQAAGKLDVSVSIASVFKALELATVETVKILDLDISRSFDDELNLVASIETDGFDSTIFQRGVYGRDKVISDVVVSDVVRAPAAEDAGGRVISDSQPIVTFTAELTVPVSGVPYEPPRASAVPAQPITITQPPSATQATGTEESVNNTDS